MVGQIAANEQGIANSWEFENFPPGTAA